jgi:hypothetical protein
MDVPILATKLYIPPPRPNLAEQPRLIERLDEGLRLTTGAEVELSRALHKILGW